MVKVLPDPRDTQQHVVSLARTQPVEQVFDRLGLVTRWLVFRDNFQRRVLFDWHAIDRVEPDRIPCRLQKGFGINLNGHGAASGCFEGVSCYLGLICPDATQVPYVIFWYDHLNQSRASQDFMSIRTLGNRYRRRRPERFSLGPSDPIAFAYRRLGRFELWGRLPYSGRCICFSADWDFTVYHRPHGRRVGAPARQRLL